jgi:hypothetical protein
MTIAEFFLKLATERGLLEEFNKNPKDALRNSGLSDEQIALLLSGNPREMRVKVTAEFDVEGEKVAYHTVYTVPTVYVPTVYCPPPPPPEKS